MQIRPVVAVAATLFALATAAPTQLAVEVKGPVPQGSNVFTYIEATAPTQLRSACPEEIRAGSPNGPVVRGPGPCILLLVVVGPGQPYSNLGWDGRDSSQNPVAPGTYYMKVAHRPVNTSVPWTDHWVPVHITPQAPPVGPLLSAPAMMSGQTWPITLADPGNPGAAYWMAASFTTNRGFGFGPVHIALDIDPLFLLSFPAPSPTLFSGFQGVTDNTGSASASIAVPAFAPRGLQVCVHAIVQSGLTVVATNPLTRVVR